MIQQTVQEHISLFKTHILSKRDIPAHLLIREIYWNNKGLLMNTTGVYELTATFLNSIENLSFKTYRRSQLLASLKCLVFYKTEEIMDNQKMIMEQMCAQKYSKVFIKPDDEKMAEKLKRNLKRYKTEQESSAEKITVPPFISYLAAQIHILGVLTEGKNGATESKC